MSRRPRLWDLPRAEEGPIGREVPRRLVIPDQTVSNERPRRLNIPDETPPKVEDRPRRLEVPDVPVAAPVAERSRAISPTPISPSPPQRSERPRTKTDDLIDRAVAIEPTLQPLRLRGRIDTILQNPNMTTVLDWGNRNLAPLQQTSNEKSRISAEISRIDAVGWLTKTRDASCKPPSFLDRFSAKPPSYYEAMLQKTRAELIAFVQQLEGMKTNFFREITDLHLDAVSMLVCVDELPDDLKVSAHNRAKTLLGSHQTAAVLQHTIEQTLLLCADHISQIDNLLSITLPQWKAAFK